MVIVVLPFVWIEYGRCAHGCQQLFLLACPRCFGYRSHMSKTSFIKVRVTAEEKQAFLDAADASGKPLSEIIRAALDRLVKRMTK